MAELKTKLSEISPISRKIDVTVPADKVQKAVDDIAGIVQKEAKIKGFRKGKAPKNVVMRYYKDRVENEAMDKLVRETYPQALEKEGAIPISAPVVDPGTFDPNKEFEYSATYEVRPEVEVEDYKGLKLEKEEVKVDKTEVDNQLDIIRDRMAQLQPLPDDVSAEDGMILVIDFEGKADGEAFKGSEAKDFMVELGAKNMLPQFEKELKGMKKGQEKGFEIDYPKDYFNKELAGKKGSFHIKVKDIKKKIVPKLDDEFAKEVGDFNSLDDVRKDVESRILEAKENENRRLLVNQILDQLSKDNQFDMPEAMINSELKAMFEGFVRQLKSQGQKFEDTGMTIDDFINRYKKEAENRVRGFLIIDAISEKENVEVTEEDVEKRLELIAAETNQTIPKVKQQYKSNNLMDGLRMQIKHEKTFDFLIDNAKIKSRKPKKDQKSSKKGKKD